MLWLYKNKIAVLSKAIQDKNIVSFKFKGYERIVEPHIIGKLKRYNRIVLCAWFVDGYTKSGFKDNNVKWRTYPIWKIKNIKITDDHFKRYRNCNESAFKEIFYKISD
jgi:hypothetical protein